MSRKNEIRKYITNNKEKILKIKGERCYLCGFDYKYILVIHHGKPIKNGGTNYMGNLYVLCPSCHAMVHHMKSKKAEQGEYDKEWFDENVSLNYRDKLVKLMVEAS